MNKYSLATVFPAICFVLLLLNINLDCKGLNTSGYNTNGYMLWLTSGAFSTIDSSDNSLLSVNYISNKNESETENELQLESWMIQFDSFQHSDVEASFESVLNAEENDAYEDWMSSPDLLKTTFHDDLPDDEIQTEEKIKFENWMIDTSGWIEKPCY